MANKRNVDPMFDEEQIEEEDPTGEQGFEAEGFQDTDAGEPDFNAEGLTDSGIEKPPASGGQKQAGIPEELQKVQNTPSEQRPDSGRVTLRERGGASKGDPAAGGTRPTD